MARRESGVPAENSLPTKFGGRWEAKSEQRPAAMNWRAQQAVPYAAVA